MTKSLTATFGLLLAASSAAMADTLIFNANGLQVDTNGKVQHFTGLLIGDDGKVKKTLGPTDATAPTVDHKVDAGGKTLLPGLIDAHGHVMALGLTALQLDLTGTKSLTELQQRLKAYAAANPNARWILGRGWNQELWADKRYPTSADLDAVVDDRPVWLGRVDGHAAVANRAAIQAAGVPLNTQSPAGGRIDGFWGLNAGLGVRFRLSDAVSANVEGRGFFFGERELAWKIDRFPIRPEPGEILREQLDPVRFTPGFFQATAGVPVQV